MTMRRVGQYEITELLGEGGIGQVHAARDTMLDREVAIKSLRPELVNDKSFVERFRIEANNLAKLAHPNITTLYSLLPEGGNLYMVMELVRGRTLEALQKGRGEPFPCEEALAIVGQAADGLAYAHSMGIVHRDIKPANLMITGGGLLKIMDFGIARVQGSQRMTRAGNAFGTPEYMSPEQVKGQDVDGRSDQYSLAIVLYEMLTGSVPFSAATDYDLGQMHINQTPERPSRRISNIEPTVEKALMRALSKTASDRFESIADFKSALGATSSMKDSASIVRKATRLVSALPASLTASAAAASSSTGMQDAEKSSIPFALKGALAGIAAAVVVGAAVFLLWRPSVSTPSARVEPAILKPDKSGAQPVKQAEQPCGISQDSMFFRPCPSGSVTSPPAQPATTSTSNSNTQQTVPLGSGRKSPFEATPESSAGRSGAPAGTGEVVQLTGSPGQATPSSGRPSSGGAAPPAQAAPASGGASSDTASDSSRAVAEAARTGSNPQSEAPAGNAGATEPPPQSRPPAEAKRGSEKELVAAFQQKNFGLAFELAEPLARDGCVECQFILGRLYETGTGGKKDPMIAADWYRKAAEGGNAKARFNLGNLYLTGNGVVKDARTAAELFHKAAVSGHRLAQFNLGMMYEAGEGINKDTGEALKWYGEAAQSDDQDLANDAKAAIARLDKPAGRPKRR